MLQRLKQKFVLINMALVTLVLLIVFGGIFYSTYRHAENASLQALSRTLTRGAGANKFEIGKHKNRLDAMQDEPPRSPLSPEGGMGASLPVFAVTLDPNNEIRLVEDDMVEVSEEIVQEAVAAALAAKGDSGVLHSLNLRYLRQETLNGSKIAFADRSDELAALKTLLLASLLVGAGGLLAFFGISLFLANWALRPVETAWNQQRQFIADASHELKTPLTVILANTGILLAHPNDTIAQQQKWISHTQTEAERMKKMVDELLFLAKSDASPAPTLRVPFDLSDLLTGCVLPFEPVAFEQGVTLESEIEPALTVCGDEGQLRQLAVILLDNACKYAGEKGTVRLTLSRAPERRARLTVQNSGEPIPPEHLPHLFERFYRADPSRARSEGGYGLGLAIAERIVQGHHGKISVTSDAADGTAFTVLLPLEK